MCNKLSFIIKKDSTFQNVTLKQEIIIKLLQNKINKIYV